MAWETRNGQRYYYRKRREGGRVVSEYVGAGDLAVAVAYLEDASSKQRRALAKREAALFQAERQRWRGVETLVGELDAAIRTLVREALTAAGYHQHKGQWRKRRMTTPDPVQDLAALARDKERAKKDTTASLVRTIDATLAIDPSAWRQIFDMSLTTVSQIIDFAIAKKDSESRPILLANWRGMIAELTTPDATPLERLLIENVATTWLTWQITVYRYEGTVNGAQGCTLTKAKYWEDRVNAAQRRYLRAVETLARVRKIEHGIALQINIADKQINVAG